MTRILQHLLLAAAVLAGTFLAWELRQPIVIVLVSLALACALQGPIEWLTERRVPHIVAVLGTFLLAMGTVAGLLALATPSVLHELEQAADDGREHYTRHAEAHPESPLVRWIEGPPKTDATEEKAAEMAAPTVVLSAAWMATSGAVTLAMYIALVAVIAFYWLFDRARFERLWLSLLSARHRPQARATWRAIEQEVGAYVRSEAVQAVLAGVLLWGGFRLLGHPYPALAALLGAVAWSIPWVGTLLTVLLVGALGALGHSFDARGLLHGQLIAPVLLAMSVLLFLEGFVERRIFDRGRYNSLIVALASITLADLYGIGWILFGPPLAVVIQIAFHELWRFEPVPEEPTRETVAARVHALQAAMADAPEVPADLSNLVTRLGTLIDGHQAIDGDRPIAESI